VTAGRYPFSSYDFISHVEKEGGGEEEVG